jgi:hypothetical protein
MCWDPCSVPALSFPKSLKVYQAGALLTPELTAGSRQKVSSARSQSLTKMKSILKGRQFLIFVSFGTYGKVSELVHPVQHLLKNLNTYCKTQNGVVVYHNGGSLMADFIKSEKLGNIRLWDGFIQYEDVVPLASLVVFTGSCCLQNISLFHKVPMLFLPILNEQFYWAKNYMHHTGVPYIDHRTYFFLRDYPTFEIVLQKAMSRQAYIDRVSKSMHNINGADRILKLLADHHR